MVLILAGGLMGSSTPANFADVSIQFRCKKPVKLSIVSQSIHPPPSLAFHSLLEGTYLLIFQNIII